MSILSERLQSARASKRLSQIEVMRLTQINNKTLSGYENAVSEPDYNTLLALAKLYGVSTDYLLGQTGNPQGIQEKKQTPADTAGENIGETIGETVSTIALSRSDNPDDDLPEEAQKQIDDFRAYIRQKYKKPE